jgi:hypothetical protein
MIEDMIDASSVAVEADAVREMTELSKDEAGGNPAIP